MYAIMYHYVRPIEQSRYPGIKGLELRMFKEQVRFLQNNGYNFVSMKDVVEGRNINDKSVLLTFDDGYIDHFTNVFPFLAENGITGVFSMPGKIIREKKVLDVNKIHFILASADIDVIKSKVFERLDYYRGSEYDIASNDELYNKLAVANRFDNKDTIFVKRLLQVELDEGLRNKITDELFRNIVSDNEAAFVDELYMSMDQVKLMSKSGMEFGIHGYDHYWMNRLEKDKLIEDIQNAQDVFESVINPDNWMCCYPYGSYSDGVIEVVKKLGATSGLATDVRTYNPDKDDIYKIPRLDTNDFPPKSENYKNY